MTQRLSQQQVRDLIVDAPRRVVGARASAAPGPVHVAAAAVYLAFVGLVAGLFLRLDLALPMLTFAGLLVAGLGFAAAWTRRQVASRGSNAAWAALGMTGMEL
ncbi:hypothetical protein [Novosphingobium clariflavum]|uniref:Uncharacterized protein n=1 Tax=Novosphingobium clariflavum TaxID=2029884 RepID=A0ABV6S185_9SPHN|nr:hypothetical protein [Novosphingobium clariflavum]